MHQQGDRVFHVGHGRGTIVEVRAGSGTTDYLLSERGKDLLDVIPPSLLVHSFYNSERYPYKVRFDKDGYTDVYSEEDLTLATRLFKQGKEYK